jgi:hypothetical protein
VSGSVKSIPDITHFENLKVFPRPTWADSMDEAGVYGNQTFFKKRSKYAK